MSFSKSWSPGPACIKDAKHLFKTNAKAQGTGPGTYDSFWNCYIFGTRFNPELDDSPGPTTYHPRLPPNMPKYSMARRITDPYYDNDPPPPPYIKYSRCHSRGASLAKDVVCNMNPKRKYKCEACLFYIRIDRQKERRKTMNEKLEAARRPPPRPKRIPSKSCISSLFCSCICRCIIYRLLRCCPCRWVTRYLFAITL